jgi:MFS family permease
MMLVINFSLIGAFYLIAPIIPLFAEKINRQELTNLAVGIFIVPVIIFRPIAGYLSDRYGYKVIGLISIGLMVLSFVGYAMVETGDQMVICRVFHGISYGMSIPPVSGYLTRIVPVTRSAEGHSYFSAVGNLGMTLLSGASLYMAGHGHLMLVFFAGIGLTLLAFLLLALVRRVEVVIHETGEVSVVAADEIMKVRDVIKVILPFASIMSAVTIYTAAVTTYIQPYSNEMGYVGHDWMFLMVNSVVIMIARMLIGKKVDRSERLVFVSLSLGCFAIGVLCLSIGKGLFFFYLAAIANGMGFSCLTACVFSLAIQFIPKSRKSLASAIFYTIYDFGACLSALGGVMGEMFGYQNTWLLMSPCLAYAYVLAFRNLRRIPPLLVECKHQKEKTKSEA